MTAPAMGDAPVNLTGCEVAIVKILSAWVEWTQNMGPRPSPDLLPGVGMLLLQGRWTSVSGAPSPKGHGLLALAKKAGVRCPVTCPSSPDPLAVWGQLTDAQREATLTAAGAGEGVPSPAGHVVCVVGLVTDQADTKVLLVKSPKRGEWELVGGKKKLDKTWQASLMEELAEEACMSGDLEPGPPMDVLEGLPVPGSPYASLILVGRIWSSGTPSPGTETHAKILDARWFTRGEIPWGEVSEIASTQVLRRWAACGSAHGPELRWNDRKNAPECARCGAAVTLDDWDDYRASLETP